MLIGGMKVYILTKRFLLLVVLVGILAGIGAFIFRVLIDLFSTLQMGLIAGYEPPPIYGEENLFEFIGKSQFRRELLIILPAMGALISALIVFFLAPEAEGEGTDATIKTYHHNKGLMKLKVVFVRMLASAIFLGSGASAGREGPICQIGGGIGSHVAMKFHLTTREREILLVSGMAAGLASIFKSPFGGALFGIEVLYKEDYEIEAFVPSIIASFVGYIVYSSLSGWEPVFHTVIKTPHPIELVFFVILGVIAGLLSRFHAWFYIKVDEFFKKMDLQRPFKPVIGGLFVGVIGYFLLPVFGVGYGWIQEALDGKLFVEYSITIIVILIFAKIIATGLSVGSGGSGGMFAPSLVIGGLLGGAFGYIISPYVPIESGGGLDMFILVGMAAFFAGAANVPLASIIMVSELAGNYNILLPAVLASFISYIVSGNQSIYIYQLRSKFESPIHLGDFYYLTLSRFHVRDAMAMGAVTVKPEDPLIEVEKLVSKYGYSMYPVVDEKERFIGIITLKEVLKINYKDRSIVKVKNVMIKGNVYVYPTDNLWRALSVMIDHDLAKIPVVSPKTMEVMGVITLRDISKLLYYKGLEILK